MWQWWNALFGGGGTSEPPAGSNSTGNSRSGGYPYEGWSLSGPRPSILSNTAGGTSYGTAGRYGGKPSSWVTPDGMVLPVGMNPNDYSAWIKSEELMKYALFAAVGLVVVRIL